MVKSILAILCALQFPCLAAANQAHKWIVVTTINYPTESLKKFATLPDWHLVVVADKKTPSDWNLDNCEFLSVERQLSLPYKIIPLLPWNHYSRKNIGYLYAIEHGAEVIYDTDDDNGLLTDTIIYYENQTPLLTYASKSNTYNPYSHFGQPTVWPRGYPLSAIQDFTTNTTTQQLITPLIQQGLVQNDPDVDAIFRLTRSLPIFFNQQPPIALAPNTFAPFNSQNTVILHDAFWGLLVPAMAAFRVSDIWRGYVTQRLLWEIGSNLCFLPANVIQLRNVHNYLRDFVDELDLYCKTEKLLSTLTGWSCEATTLFERMQDLYSLLINKAFFKSQEATLLDAWISDLTNIGYNPPAPITNAPGSI